MWQVKWPTFWVAGEARIGQVPWVQTRRGPAQASDARVSGEQRIDRRGEQVTLAGEVVDGQAEELVRRALEARAEQLHGAHAEVIGGHARRWRARQRGRPAPGQVTGLRPRVRFL
jgi:hypothetical protein